MRKIASIFRDNMGWIASFIAILVFVSQKPLSEFDFYANYCVDQNESSQNLRESFQEILDLRGEVVSINMNINVDLVLDMTESEAQNEIQDLDSVSCRLLSEPHQIAAPGQQVFLATFEEGVHFVDDVISPDENQNNYFGVVLVLPTASQEFVEVNFCEGGCYQLRGAVRFSQIFEAEGYLGLAITPVDVHKNSELTAKYECRLKIDRASSPLFGWFACLF